MAQIPYQQEASDLHAALTRLDHAKAGGRISVDEHDRRVDAIDHYLRQRGVRFGLRLGGLREAWMCRRR